jgi:hypothetical protein
MPGQYVQTHSHQIGSTGCARLGEIMNEIIPQTPFPLSKGPVVRGSALHLKVPTCASHCPNVGLCLRGHQDDPDAPEHQIPGKGPKGSRAPSLPIKVLLVIRNPVHQDVSNAMNRNMNPCLLSPSTTMPMTTPTIAGKLW